jgi:alkylation response protein AidB-like acyl-CoA dehydrogenase
MDFSLSDRQARRVRDARALAREVLAPNAERYDRAGTLPLDDYAALRDAGYFGMLVPEAYGGWGLDLVTYALVMHELGQGAAATAMGLNMHSFAMWQIAKVGDAAFQERWYPRIMGEKAMVGGWGSEPGAGLSQGRFAIGTTIKPQGDDLVVNGSKFFCTLAGIAKYAQVLVSTIETANEVPIEAITAMIVPVDAPGVVIGAEWDVLGMRATFSPTVKFENVVLPKSHMMGAPGRNMFTVGLTQAISIGYSAVNTAVARSALDFAVGYAAKKTIGASAHADSPLVQTRVGELATTVDASYAMMLHAAFELDRDFAGASARQAGARARAVAMRTVLDVTAKAFEICGGTTVSARYPLGRLHREARTMTLMNPGYDGLLTLAGRGVLEAARGAGAKPHG